MCLFTVLDQDTKTHFNDNNTDQNLIETDE